MRRRGWRGMAVVLLCGLAVAAAAVPYRALQVFTTSTAEGARVTARTTFRNRGTAGLQVLARLQPNPALDFAGAHFVRRIPAGGEAVWTWECAAPEGLTRAVLAGDIDLNGKHERDLYIAVQGPDPLPPPRPGLLGVEAAMTAFGPNLAAFQDEPGERITERGRVTGTFAPRAQESIRAEMAQQKAPTPTLTLAAGGASDYAIVVDAAAAPALAAAVEDLRRVIRLQSGAELPVAVNAHNPAIRLRLAPVDAPGLQDAYHLATRGRDVVIEAAGVDGLRNGVYGLLTDYLDAHWFQPGALGEEIGRLADRAVRLPALDEVRGSPWFSTNGACWGADARWDQRNRAIVNRGRMNFGHAWHSYVNAGKYPYDTYPDYYARDRAGKIRLNDQSWTFTNLCTTNPAVIDLVAKAVNAHFAARPDALVASLEPNDYSLMCLCDACLAVDRQYGQTREDGRQVADRLLHFSQEIARRLEPRFRDKYLGILIYGNQDAPPVSAKPHDRHAGIICNFMLHYDHSRPWTDPTSPRNVEFHRRAQAWGALLTQFGYYDYYGHWYYFGPWAMAHKLREDLPAFRALGGTFLVLENQPNFAAQGLNHYLSARLMWDPDADVDLLMEAFFTRYYGPAAAPMRRYWLAAERWYALERPGIMTDTRVAARPDFWTELDGCLAEAERIAAALPAAERRFADRVGVARDGFDFGRLVYRYEADYGQLAHRDGRPVDHAAAVAFLQAHRARLEAIQARYPAGDPDRPPLVARYFRLNLDAMLKEHRAQP